MDSTDSAKSYRIRSPIMSGLLYAMFFLLLAVLLFSLLLFVTRTGEKELNSWMFVVHGVCTLCGGFAAGKRSISKGWYIGGLTGVLYGVLIALVGFLAYDAIGWSRVVLLLLICFAAGALGGIVGVNVRK